MKFPQDLKKQVHIEIVAFNFEGSVRCDDDGATLITVSIHQGARDDPAEVEIQLDGPQTIEAIRHLSLAMVNATGGTAHDRAVENLAALLAALDLRIG